MLESFAKMPGFGSPYFDAKKVPINYAWTGNLTADSGSGVQVISILFSYPMISSVNIAKPMHMGHFRATVVGNFIKNINLAAGNNVVALNYLGDWGTQFGNFINCTYFIVLIFEEGGCHLLGSDGTLWSFTDFGQFSVEGFQFDFVVVGCGILIFF